MSYNGWKNYETWDVSLWFDNEESTYNEVRELASYRADMALTLADELREYADDLAEAVCPGSRSGASFVCDLLGAALSEVDWREIAEHLLSELAEA